MLPLLYYIIASGRDDVDQKAGGVALSIRPLTTQEGIPHNILLSPFSSRMDGHRAGVWRSTPCRGSNYLLHCVNGLLLSKRQGSHFTAKVDSAPLLLC